MENKIRFLHTADLHLGAAVSSTAAIADRRRNEALLTLEGLFSLCASRDIPLMLISGDLLENNSVDAKYFETFLRCVKDHPEVTVVFAAGNHDPLTSDSPFLNSVLPDNLIVAGADDTCIALDHLPVRIYGRSFSNVYMQGRNNFSLCPENDDKLNIMVLHGDLGSDLSGNYNTVTKGFVEASGMDYIALGHIHAFMPPQRLCKTYFAYPGTPEPHGFDETGAKGVILGELTKGELRYEFLHTARRTYEAVEADITAAESNGSAEEIIINLLKSKYGEAFADNLYKIILTGQIPTDVRIDADEICARLAETLYFVKLRDNTEIAVDLELLSRENSLKGKFVKLMSEKISAADEAQKEALRKALFIGLKAFSSEVKYNEN